MSHPHDSTRQGEPGLPTEPVRQDPTRAEGEQAPSGPQEVRAEPGQALSGPQVVAAELEQARRELEALRAELEQARREREALRAELERAQQEQEAIRRELEERRREAERNWDQFLRARADFDNYRRRMEREAERLAERGRQQLLLEFLEVVDNFQRALMPQVLAAADPDGLRRGLELIARQLDNLLGKEGVEPIEAVGKPFDPRLHEAVAVWECEDVEQETVTDEMQKGYLYRGEVLRPARVRVARPPVSGTQAGGSAEQGPSSP